MTERKTRKLLTAAVGVATVSYVVGCGRTDGSPGRNGDQVLANDISDSTGTPSTDVSVVPVPPPSPPANTGLISGNLVAPPDIGQPPPIETFVPPEDTGIISGNLLPPPYPTEVLTTDVPTSEPPVVSAEVDAAPPPDTTQPWDGGFVISGNLVAPPSTEPDAQVAVDAAVDGGNQ